MSGTATKIAAMKGTSELRILCLLWIVYFAAGEIACPRGSFGDNCESTCHCEGGHDNCDKEGYCNYGCEAGRAGFTCQEECIAGSFGKNCALACHCHEKSTTTCNKTTGVCEGDCEAGYMGNNCQSMCPSNNYGVNCIHDCSCKNRGRCNRKDGSCACEGKWMGKICNEITPDITAVNDIEAYTGEMVYISCTAIAIPKPVMNILYSSIVGDDLQVKFRDLQSNLYQAFVKYQPTSAGKFLFVCKAENPHGEDTKNITVTVIEPPRLISKPELVESTNVSLTAKWKKWNFTIDEGGNPKDEIEYQVIYKKSVEKEWKNVDPWSNELSNTVNGLTPNSLYDVAVKCRTNRKKVEGDASESLSIKTKCGVPTEDGVAGNFSPENISESTITVTWKRPLEAHLRCTLREYHLTYYPKINENTGHNESLDADAESVQLEGLIPDTVYVIRLYAVTEVETSKYSANLTLRTDAIVPDPVTNLKCRAVDKDPSRLDVSWEALTKDKDHIKEYVVHYTLMDRGHCKQQQASYENSSELTADTKIELLDLYPYSIYNVSVSGRTSAKESKPVSMNGRTAESIPSAPPSNVQCVSSTRRSLKFRWDPIPCEEANGIITYYEYAEFFEKDIPSESNRLLKTSLSSPSFHNVTGSEVEIQNLTIGTRYGFKVRGRTKVGPGNFSDIIINRTDEDIPSQPQNLEVISRSPHEIGLHWRGPKLPNGKITQYQIQFSDHVLSSLAADMIYNVNEEHDETHSTLIKGLTAATDYLIKIRASTSAGWGEFCSPISDRTLDGIPSQPQNLTVSSRSPHEIGLKWAKPDVPNGIVSQYQIQFLHNRTSSLVADVIYNVSEEYDENPSTVVEGLTAATDYLIKIRASTSAGWGNFCSPIYDRTLDGIPGEPSSIAVSHNGLTTLNLTWKEPDEKNGNILGYKITYRPVFTMDSSFNVTPFTKEELEVKASVQELTLEDLHSSTEYNISLMAKTSAGYGFEVSLTSWTVIEGDHVSPSMRPLDVNKTSETATIVFSITGSSSVYEYQVIVEFSSNNMSINESLLSDYITAVVKNRLPYYIAAQLDPKNMSKESEYHFVVGDDKMWGEYKNVRLNPGQEYSIRIRTLFFKGNEIASVLSEPYKITSESTVVPEVKKIGGMNLLAFILMLLAVIIFLTILIFMIRYYIVKRREIKFPNTRAAYGHDDASDTVTLSVVFSSTASESFGGPIANESYWTLPRNEKNATLKKTKTDCKIVSGLRIESLQFYLTDALATNKIAEEFRRLVVDQASPCSIALKTTNSGKNRYRNILPYDRQRVVLDTSSKNESDYINASYVDGYKRPREYIITQGPLEHTIVDFWNMVWQEKASVIVMLTGLFEDGKKKCSKYWPECSTFYGDMQVFVTRSEVYTDFVVRTILIKTGNAKQPLHVEQYHFTTWPDQTVPKNTNNFIKFLKQIREDHPVMQSPMVVHCSAGSGRSGTYVAIDILCQQATEEKRVDVFRFVNNARLQRMQLVQTLEQYTFIYEALIEAYHFDDTCVPFDKTWIHLNELNNMSPIDKKILIVQQYNKLNSTQKKVDTNRCSVALSDDNIFRNRYPCIVPMDATRVSLQSDDEPELSDYINAVFVDGHGKKNAYLATQMPMTQTIADFWRMIYLNKSSLIVMLNEPDEKGLNVGIYWPEVGSHTYGDFNVELVTVEERSNFVTRVMIVTHLKNKNEEPHKITQVQYKGWNSEMKPASAVLPLQIVELCYQSSAGGPITIHCMDGATRTGLFIAARNVCDQIKADDVLDVFQVVKSIRTNRPEFIPNLDQYRFLFEIAQELSSE